MCNLEVVHLTSAPLSWAIRLYLLEREATKCSLCSELFYHKEREGEDVMRGDDWSPKPQPVLL